MQEQKENYINMESWQQMAYIYSISKLPVEERNYFIRHFTHSRPIMVIYRNGQENDNSHDEWSLN